jgi:hypothetical protein
MIMSARDDEGHLVSLTILGYASQLKELANRIEEYGLMLAKRDGSVSAGLVETLKSLH